MDRVKLELPNGMRGKFSLFDKWSHKNRWLPKKKLRNEIKLKTFIEFQYKKFTFVSGSENGATPA